MIAAAESPGCAAPDTGDVVVVERPVADVNPMLGQFRGELTAYSAVPTGLAQEVLAGGHGCIRCRIFDDVGHETQRHQGHLVVLNDFLIWHDSCEAVRETRCGTDTGEITS
ncbi:hypothetical protein [Mesorhizobium sp. M0590]|uniref:hypothetical protein n=1 Tax=Mesorhizobium sp. M0590 TaxID=2956966 RepID=UPI00333C6FE8